MHKVAKSPKMMDERYKYSLEELKRTDYRTLQQIAKNFKLPANVKKMAIIELIHTKVFGSSEDLKSLLQQVKRSKKKRVQRAEVSSTSSSAASKNTSATITTTTIKPETGTTPNSSKLQNQPKSSMSILRAISYRYPSERVLRNRTYRNAESYNVLNIKNTVIEVLTADRNDSSNRNLVNNGMSVTKHMEEQKRNAEKRSNDEKYKIYSHQNRMPLIPTMNRKVPILGVSNRRTSVRDNGTTMAPTCRRNIAFSGGKLNISTENKSVQTENRRVLNINQATPHKRHQRALSGIYPLEKTDKSIPYIYELVHGGITVTHKDGTTSKIDSYVKKPIENKISNDQNYIHKTNNVSSAPKRANKSTNAREKTRSEQKVVIVPNISQYENTPTAVTTSYINDLLYHSPNVQTDSLKYTYNTKVPNTKYQNDVTANVNSSFNEEYVNYCHKKIRAEQIRTKRDFRKNELPRIHEVFKHFQNSDVTQPIYVQVGDEAEKPPLYQYFIPDSVTKAANVLDMVYNIQTATVPLPLLNTTTHTKCVYSTPIVTTAVIHPTASYMQYNTPTYTDESFMEQNNSGQRDDPDHDTTNEGDVNSPAPESMSLGASVTIPDLVEDAMELISQDGDYLERIEMDDRVSCLFCCWGGGRPALENHIKMEHSNKIHYLTSSEWIVDVSLRSLICAWSKVCVSIDGSMFALVTRGDEGAVTVACVSVSQELSPRMGSLMIVNSAYPRPHIWQGQIPELSADLQHFCGNSCLSVPLSGLGLARRVLTSATYDAPLTVRLTII